MALCSSSGLDITMALVATQGTQISMALMPALPMDANMISVSGQTWGIHMAIGGNSNHKHHLRPYL